MNKPRVIKGPKSDRFYRVKYLQKRKHTPILGKIACIVLIIRYVHRRLWRPLSVRSFAPTMNTSSQAPLLMKTKGQRFQVIKSILLFGQFPGLRKLKRRFFVTHSSHWLLILEDLFHFSSYFPS